jgi:hypothetical protein
LTKTGSGQIKHSELWKQETFPQGMAAPVWLYLFNHLTDLGDPPAPFEFVPHASQRAYVFRDIRSETVFFTTF